MELKIINKDELKKNYKKYQKLYASCFSSKQSIEELKWRYEQNPYNEVIIAVVEYKDEWISLYATTTKFIQSKGIKYKVALGLNTMTHPNFSGQGLFVKTTKYIQKELSKKGFSALFCFPNNLSNPIYKKDIGWKIIYEIPTLELLYKNLEEGIFRLKKYWDYSYNIEEELKKIQIVKDEKYLEWRYRKHFRKIYSFLYTNNKDSYFVIKRYDNLINIVDYKINSVGDLIELFEKIQDLNLIGVNKITIWVSNFLNLHFFFEKMGFVNNRPITYFGVNKLNDELTDNIYDFDKWHITMGDDNVY